MLKFHHLKKRLSFLIYFLIIVIFVNYTLIHVKKVTYQLQKSIYKKNYHEIMLCTLTLLTIELDLNTL